MTVTELCQKTYDRHQDKFNANMVQFRDACLLSSVQCDELLTVINRWLPGGGNNVSHLLRQVLCEAVEVIRCENALVMLKMPETARFPRANENKG